MPKSRAADLRFALAAALCIGLTMSARAEYSPDMEPGRLRVRHASWAAALACEEHWPAEGPRSVNFHITLNRRGRALSVQTEPVTRAFARCVLRQLRTERFSVTGPDAMSRRWEVISRFVFPE